MPRDLSRVMPVESSDAHKVALVLAGMAVTQELDADELREIFLMVGLLGSDGELL